MTGTPEDAEAAWQAWIGTLEAKRKDRGKPDFLAGFAARPSVTVDEITGLLAGHEKKRGIRDLSAHCTCGWNSGSLLVPPASGLAMYADAVHHLHVASVIVAHITGEGA